MQVNIYIEKKYTISPEVSPVPPETLLLGSDVAADEDCVVVVFIPALPVTSLEVWPL